MRFCALSRPQASPRRSCGAPKPPIALASGTILAPARALADFSLTDNQGRGFGTANLRGHWSLMFFGYTNCPDYCPATLTTLAALEKQLRAAGTVAPPQVIFVSVDAKRDTPAQLNQFVPNFDPGFIGLTAADQPAIEASLNNGVSRDAPIRSEWQLHVDHSECNFRHRPCGRRVAL